MKPHLAVIHINLELAIKHPEVRTGDELCNGGSEFLADAKRTAGDVLEMIPSLSNPNGKAVVG